MTKKRRAPGLAGAHGGAVCQGEVVVKKIFVSYRRTDSSAESMSLFVRLREHFGPDRIFLDVSGIGKGIDSGKVLNDVLAETGALIAVIGPHSA